MRFYLGAEDGLVAAVSWEDEEWTSAFLFLGWWSLEVMFSGRCGEAFVASAYPIPVLESWGLLN